MLDYEIKYWWKYWSDSTKREHDEHLKERRWNGLLVSQAQCGALMLNSDGIK